jgi:hypothetical protein
MTPNCCHEISACCHEHSTVSWRPFEGFRWRQRLPPKDPIVNCHVTVQRDPLNGRRGKSLRRKSSSASRGTARSRQLPSVGGILWHAAGKKTLKMLLCRADHAMTLLTIPFPVPLMMTRVCHATCQLTSQVLPLRRHIIPVRPVTADKADPESTSDIPITGLECINAFREPARP